MDHNSIEAMAARQRARNMELEADADDVDSLLMPSPSPNPRANPLRSFPGPAQDPVVMAAARASQERRNAEHAGSASSTPRSSGDGSLRNRGAEQNRFPMHPPTSAATPPPPVPTIRGEESSPHFGTHSGGNGGGNGGGGGRHAGRPNSGSARPRSSRAATRSPGQQPRPSSSGGGGPPPAQTAQGSAMPSSERSAAMDGGAATAGLGDEAAARYLRARVTALQQQVDHFSGQATDLDQRLKEAESNAKSDQEEARKVQRAHAALSEKLEKESSSRQAAEVEAARLREEVSRLRSEVETTKRGARAAGGEARSRDVQLTRAQEEVAKHKEQLAALRAAKAEEAETQRSECGKLEAKVSRLERQKSELLGAFKKQAKLVDVLRRQRVHVEAARALAFTEEEFMRTLDWGA